jgi:hypothetical protein
MLYISKLLWVIGLPGTCTERCLLSDQCYENGRNKIQKCASKKVVVIYVVSDLQPAAWLNVHIA